VRPKPSAPPGAGKGHAGHEVRGRAIKVTVVVEAADIATVPVPDGQPRVMLRVAAGGCVVMADVSAKSVRRAIAAVREHGADNVVALVQGKLAGGDALAEAGLAVRRRIAYEQERLSGKSDPIDRSGGQTHAKIEAPAEAKRESCAAPWDEASQDTCRNRLRFRTMRRPTSCTQR
jgi:hypothetical protein